MAALCALTVLSASMLPVSVCAADGDTGTAESSANDFAEVLKTKPADTFEIVTADDAVFPDQVGSITTSSLQGLAVTCEDTQAIISSGIGNYAVVWSDGKWGNGGIPSDGCRMQPLTGFAECYGKTGEYEYVSGSEYVSYSVYPPLLNSEEPVYLLTLPLVLIDNSYWEADYSGLLETVLADDSIKLLGAGYGTQTRATLYQSIGRAVVETADTDTEQILAALSEYGKVSPYYSGCYLLENADEMSFEEELLFCKQIEQISGVISAYPAGVTPETSLDSITDIRIEFLPYSSQEDAEQPENGSQSGADHCRQEVYDAFAAEAVQAAMRVQFGAECLYYSEETGIWYDENGTPLTEKTEQIQTALYQGKQYTVDLKQMQVCAEDGTVNEELTGVLPDYLSFRPVFISSVNGKYIDDLFAEEDEQTVRKQLQEISDKLPLIYRFDDTAEPFCMNISLCGEVIGGMEYAEDAGDDLGARPWTQEENGAAVETGSYQLGMPAEQTVDVFIMYWARSENEIRTWAENQADEYAMRLDRDAYTEDEIVQMRDEYYTKIYEEVYSSRYTVRENEILALAGISAEDAVCDREWGGIACSLTLAQVKAIANLNYLRRIMLKSSWDKQQKLYSGGDQTITDPDVMREMLTKFIAENGLDAAVVSNEKYPDYPPIIIEYNAGEFFEEADDTPNYLAPIMDYIIKTGMDNSQIGVVPIVNGEPVLIELANGPETGETTGTTAQTTDTQTTETTYTVLESEETTTETTYTVLESENKTTETAASGESGLPQTGNNSVSKLLLSVAAMMMIAAGAVMLSASGIIRRRKNQK